MTPEAINVYCDVRTLEFLALSPESRAFGLRKVGFPTAQAFEDWSLAILHHGVEGSRHVGDGFAAQMEMRVAKVMADATWAWRYAGKP